MIAQPVRSLAPRAEASLRDAVPQAMIAERLHTKEPMPQSADLLYFSPTGTTRAIIHAIAGGLAAPRASTYDTTLPESRVAIPELRGECLVVAAPVHFGRVQAHAAAFLRRIRPHRAGLPAVVVVVYGNRHWDDALLELCDIVTDAGYRVAGAAAFIGEHSFSDEAHPLAPGRPDAHDLAAARRWGEAIRAKLEAGPVRAIRQVPGKRPYREGHAEPAPPPETRLDECTLCGTCESVCPTGAVRTGDGIETDPAACIRCAACVKRCPTQARVLSSPAVDKVRRWLQVACTERREPELFL